MSKRKYLAGLIGAIAYSAMSYGAVSHGFVSADSMAKFASRYDAARGPKAAARQSGMSLDQAIAMVQAKYGAQVMRANTVQEADGRIVHYIRLMSADRSRVWTVRVDAATGREY